MRKLRDVLRLRLEAGLSYRQINASTKVSIGRIQKQMPAGPAPATQVVRCSVRKAS